MSEALFVAERRRAILERLKTDGRVSVNNLSSELRVSAVTIRQDLRVLENEGLLQRTYGGAVSRAINSSELAFEVRNQHNPDAKSAIAAAAAALVRPHDTVALDASSTAYALIPHLKQIQQLTIVTNGLIIAQSFLEIEGFNILMPGGRLRKDSVSIVGQPDGLPDINFNIGFFGAHGISRLAGVSDMDAEEVAMKQAMIRKCVHPIIIADASKWDQVAPYTVLPSDSVPHIITAGQPPPELVDQYRQGGTRIDIVALSV